MRTKQNNSDPTLDQSSRHGRSIGSDTGGTERQGSSFQAKLGRNGEDGEMYFVSTRLSARISALAQLRGRKQSRG